MRLSKHFYNSWYATNKKEIFFRGKEEVILSAVQFCDANRRKKCILFANGRSDNIKQYTELYHDLYNMGLDVYALDHRGQGYSSRLASNSYSGHVESYDDYAEDIDAFYHKFIKPMNYEEFYVAGHSMGATSIALWLIQNTNISPRSVFLTAPLFGAIAPIPEWVGHPLAWLACLFGFSKSLVPTVGKPAIGPFSSNRLTADKDRYEYMCELNRLEDGTPILVKPTNGWALASYRAMKKLRKDLRKIKDLNVYLFQAEEEQYVDNSYHVKYAPKSWKLEMLLGESHHLWHCRDKARDKIFEIIAREIRK